MPDVDATAVPDVNVPTPDGVPPMIGEVSVLLVSVSVVALPTKVSVEAGSVNVLVPLTAGACKVIAPLVSPATLI